MKHQKLMEIERYVIAHKKNVAIGGAIFSALLIVLILKLVSLKSVSDSEKAKAQHQDGNMKSFHLTQETLKDNPIVIGVVSEVEPSEEILLPGRVHKDPTQTVMVTARAQGRLSSVLVKEADDVKAGQVLAVLQSTEVAQAQSDHLKTFLKLKTTQRQLDRAQELLEHQIMSAKEFEVAELDYRSEKAQLDASRTRLKNLNLTDRDITKLESKHLPSGELTIRSPQDGVVIERKAAIGQPVTSEDLLFTIGRIDQVWIVLDVYEKDIPMISEGVPAEVRIADGPAHFRTLTAKVARIAPVIDPSTRSAKVWLEVKNTDEDLRLGQAIQAKILGTQQDQVNKKVLAVPIEAVHKIEGDSIVFVQLSEVDFEPRKVQTGWSSDHWMEIKSGLKLGEHVVSKGSFILKSEFLRN